MKIVILCKRAPQNKDLWDRPYGRFYHIAKFLAQQGDEVHFVLLNYSGGLEFTRIRDGFRWHSINLGPNPFRYYQSVRAISASIGADWIVGLSDTYFGICAAFAGKATGANVLIDAYDNYESYIPWCLPLHWLWRWAVGHSTAITAAGPGLLGLMARSYRGPHQSVIEMSADPQFTRESKSLARSSLNLPLDAHLIAYTGSLSVGRGVRELLEVIDRLREEQPEIMWIFTGACKKDLRLPDNCLHLGYVADSQVVDVLRSADLVVSINKPGAFGDYGYPVKIYEALAVGVPVVAFSTESTDFVMRNNMAGLIEFGDIDAMVTRILSALESPYEVNAGDSGWAAQVATIRHGLLSWR